MNAGLGFAIASAFGLGLLPAVLLAGVVYISSSAVITKSLVDSGWIAEPETDPILGTLVVEDVVIAVYLTVVTAIVLVMSVLGTACIRSAPTILAVSPRRRLRPTSRPTADLGVSAAFYRPRRRTCLA